MTSIFLDTFDIPKLASKEIISRPFLPLFVVINTTPLAARAP